MKAKEIVHQAAKVLGVLAPGQNLDAEELQDGLNALNSMLAQWAVSKLFVYKATDVIISLNSAQSVYEVGEGGDVEATFAQLSEKAELTINGCVAKTTMYRDTNDSKPYTSKVKYSQGVGVWHFVIECTGATQLKIKTFSLPDGLEALDEIEVPAVYLRALKYNLALEMAPEYQIQPDAMLLKNASASMRTLKRANATPRYAQPDQTLMRIGRCHRGGYYS